MKYNIGDNVIFKLESGEVQEGDIQFIDRERKERIYYINGVRLNRWAYKVPERHILIKQR